MNNIKNTKITYLLGGLSLILSLGNAGAASTIFRIIEGGTYVQEAPYTVEPHTRLDTLFPGATVVGDAKKTSDNQWAALANSAYVIGGQSTLTRGRDIMEDYQVNFIDPSTSALNYYFEFYSNNAGTTVSRLGYPLTLTGGPMAG
ncbi:MAG: sorting protein, partial [Verrucomicrobiales bacterium]|nr:sorting protein [Verrucomicrobiales bacterium]